MRPRMLLQAQVLCWRCGLCPCLLARTPASTVATTTLTTAPAAAMLLGTITKVHWRLLGSTALKQF